MKKNIRAAILTAILMVPLCAYFAVSVNQPIKLNIAKTQAELNAWNYEQYAGRVSQTNERIEDLTARLAQAERDKAAAEANNDPLGVLYAQATIQSCTNEMENARAILSEYTLQRDTSYFYVESKTEIVEEERRKAEFAAFQSSVQAQRFDAQISYLSALEQELQEKLRIEQKKFDLGYTTSLTVQNAGAQLKAAKLQRETAEAERAFVFESLRLTSGEYTPASVPDTLEPLQTEAYYIKKFHDNSVQLRYYRQQAKSFRDYLDATDGQSYDAEKIELQRQLAELNAQQYELDLELYVKSLLVQYQSAQRSVQALEQEKNVLETEIYNNQILLEKGRITPITVIELQTRHKKLEADRLSFLYDTQIIKHILEHQVENQTV